MSEYREIQILSFPSTGPLVILTLISRILFSDLLFYYCLPVDLVALKHFQSNILSFCSGSAFVKSCSFNVFLLQVSKKLCFLLLVHAFRGFPNFLASVPFFYWFPSERPQNCLSELGLRLFLLEILVLQIHSFFPQALTEYLLLSNIRKGKKFCPQRLKSSRETARGCMCEVL